MTNRLTFFTLNLSNYKPPREIFKSRKGATMLFDLKTANKTLLGLTSKEVIYHLENGNFPLTCRIFNPMKQRWESVSDSSHIARELAVKLSQKPLSFNYDSLFYHWSLKNYLSHHGFFSLIDVIDKLQKNEIQKSELIKHPTMKDWEPIEKLPIFKDESVRELYQIRQLKTFFKERKKPRPEV